MKRFAPVAIGSILLAASSLVLAAQAGDAPGAAPKAKPVSATAAPAKGSVQKAAFNRVSEAEGYQELLNTYCVACHNEGNPTAGLAFDTKDLKEVPSDAELWEKVTRKLRGRMMPPPGFPRPEDKVYAGFVGWLEGYLDHAAAQSPEPGRVVVHRLNRKEYANAVRDLFKVEVNPVSLLPQDDTSASFDNIADVLQVSPAFLDQYITAARTVAIKAIGDSTLRSERVTFKPPVGISQGLHVPGLPPGTRGGIVVDYAVPAEGEYDLTFQGPGYGRYDDLLRKDRFIALVDGKIVYDSDKQDDPNQDAKLPPGVPLTVRNTTVRVRLKGGVHRIGGTYIATTPAATKWVLAPLVPAVGVPDGHVLSELQITGPIKASGLADTPSREAVFICRPKSAAEEEPCARKIISSIARKAFRRPITEADMAPRMRFYQEGHKAGGFETGVQQAIMSVLASPNFLYRTTTVPKNAAPGATVAISDLDLASRLSFFLWSSLPDEPLLKLAEQNRLRDPKVLEGQVKRMLADPRSESLASNFAFQWLRLDPMLANQPDPVLFPEFDEPLRAAFGEEIRLFVDSVFREDQSVLKLMTADYTFVNERLAKHYGLNVTGNEYQRVKLENPNRWGILGKGAVLFATSYGDRTAPVIRGAWLLENVLGTPPSPPPPNVEGFPENVVGERARTIRALLAQHRENPTCHACHAIMDPLGLSLENFDAIGGWRLKDRFAGEPIDSSAEMVTGDKLNGVNDLRGEIMKRPAQFVDVLTEKLMTFGLGRKVDHRDMPTIRAIVHKAEASNYRFSDIVMGIVQSDQFRKTRVPGKAGPTQIASTKH